MTAELARSRTLIATNSAQFGGLLQNPVFGSLSLESIIYGPRRMAFSPVRGVALLLGIRVVRKHMPPFFTFPTAGPQARDCQHTLFLRGFSGCVLALTRARSITFYLAFSDPQLLQDGPRPGAT